MKKPTKKTLDQYPLVAFRLMGMDKIAKAKMFARIKALVKAMNKNKPDTERVVSMGDIITEAL